MDIMDFLQSWTFMIIMAVLLIVLIGVLLFLRNKRSED
ncbi:MAG TPA: LPXTG cell wall anchor domain-containing protein [Gemmataceae bacterium]